MAPANGHLEQEVSETHAPTALALVGDADLDRQVATAKRYPRSITTFMRKAQEMATLSPEIAAACIYALPRDGKTVEGPSARFAEMMMHAWGNMRAEGRALGDDGQYVTSRGVAWDLEVNAAVGYEVKRRITNRRGETYNADMITVTGNAGASIALRNAILKAIPSPFWKPIYNACRQVVAGDARTFASRRDNMLHEFAVMGVTAERLCLALGVKGKMDITLEHMATLAGFYTALKDGDTTIEEAFPESGGLGDVKPAERKSQQGTTQPPASTQPPATNSSDSKPAAEGPNVGVIVDVVERGGGAMVKLDTKFQAATKDAEMIRAAKSLREKGTRVELVTRPSSDPAKFAPVLTELIPLTDEAQS